MTIFEDIHLTEWNGIGNYWEIVRLVCVHDGWFKVSAITNKANGIDMVVMTCEVAHDPVAKGFYVRHLSVRHELPKGPWKEGGWEMCTAVMAEDLKEVLMEVWAHYDGGDELPAETELHRLTEEALEEVTRRHNWASSEVPKMPKWVKEHYAHPGPFPCKYI